jgi:hypothetical protein
MQIATIGLGLAKSVFSGPRGRCCKRVSRAKIARVLSQATTMSGWDRSVSVLTVVGVVVAFTMVYAVAALKGTSKGK